ncbi:GntR family transcriptional regulator [Blastococcus deserti]
MPDSRVDTVLLELQTLVADLDRRGEGKLPPETNLSRVLGVSRATLRDALGRLEADGVIERRPGRGTTIVGRREPVRYPANIIGSFADFLREAGVTHRLVEFSVVGVDIDESLGELGGDGAPRWAFRSTRCYEVDGVRAALLCHLLPEEIQGQPLQVERLVGDIVPFLETVHGVEISRVTSAVTAEEASAEVADMLGLKPGAALLVMYTHMVDETGTPVALGALAFNPKIVSLGVEALEHVNAGGQSQLHLGWLRAGISSK